jgi:hypothetical protein
MERKIAQEKILLAINNLRIEDITRDNIINSINYLKEARDIIKNLIDNKNKEYTEKEIYLFNPIYHTHLAIQDIGICSRNGQEIKQGGCKSTDYLEIPQDVKQIGLLRPLIGYYNYYIGAFYNENKEFMYGIGNEKESLYGAPGIEIEGKDVEIEVPQGAKYIRVCSASNGDMPFIYYIGKAVEKHFVHESNKSLTVNTIKDLKNLECKTGDKVTTRGYYSIGDGGEGQYNIMTYEEFFELLPNDIKLVRNGTSFEPVKVDEFGNHTLVNGLVAKLTTKDFTTPEQWGAKGNGKTNDCEPFVHMFAHIKTGKIIFKKNAKYILGLIKESDTVASFTDNPYKAFMTGNLLGGQLYSKPIMANINNVEFVGNNATISIPDGVFGSTGMGILNFSGVIKGLKIHGLSFDGKGRTLFSNNKNSNHTIFYAPPTFTSDSKYIQQIHPAYNSLNNYSNGYVEDVEIYDCTFFDAGAMYRKAGDWGGDFILIVNPEYLNNLNIHHNNFEAWGRWVFAIDLGGNGECLTNIKFNDNVCIGANVGEMDETYNLIKDKNGKTTYVIPTPDYIKRLDGGDKNEANTYQNRWRWRALGFIDFEARKCFKNVEMQRNIIKGSAGWAINGNSRISEDFLIKDNEWCHYGGGYSYLLEFYSGYLKNWIIEDNIIPGGGMKAGITAEGLIVRNNIGNFGIRSFGLQGENIIEGNKRVKGDTTNYHSKLSLEGKSCPAYIEEKDHKATLIFRDNEFSLTGGENYNVDYLTLEMYNNVIDTIDIRNFQHKDFGINDFSTWINGNFNILGYHLLEPLPKLLGAGCYYKEGEVVAPSIKGFGVLESSFYKLWTPNEAQRNAMAWNGYNYGNLLNKEIEGETFSDYKIVCCKEGIIPQGSEYGFRDKMNCYCDIVKHGNKVQQNAYIYTEDNLYKCLNDNVSTGTIEEKPTHTEGIAYWGECELLWVDKIGRAKLIGFNE